MWMVGPLLVAMLAACSGLKTPPGPVAPEHGVRLTFGVQADASSDVPATQADLVRVFEQRLSDAGVLQYRVDAADNGRVLVDLGPDGMEAGRSVLLVPGVLEFHEVDDGYAPALGMYMQSTEGDAVARTGALQARGDLPASRWLRLDDRNTPYILVDKPILSNEHVASAERRDEPWGIAVSVQLTDDGKTRFAEHTARLVNKRIAIVYDGAVMSAPVVREPITGGQALISLGQSGDPEQVAQELVSVLRSGVLPAGVVLEEEMVF